MSGLPVTYKQGTHRLVPPEQSLARIGPVLDACGITRCADVTGLDSLGLPVYCAIRPSAVVMQVSNGKGLTHDSAKVSALMEAIEVFHAEAPERDRLRTTTARVLRSESAELLLPTEIDGYDGRYFSEDFVMTWVEGLDLLSEAPVWAPASAVYFGCYPAVVQATSNGLASGNHLIEATLHALYELIERDAGFRLAGDDGKLQIGTRARVLDPLAIDDADLRRLIETIHADGSSLAVLSVDSCVPVHTFWAVLLNPSSLVPMTTFNIGWGTHLDRNVAAGRAITEAVQSRLTAIHGSREDILAKPVYRMEAAQDSAAFRFFSALQPDASWDELAARSRSATGDLQRDYEWLTRELGRSGQRRLVRFDLTKPDIGIPVVKVIAPDLKFNRKLY